MRTEQNKDGSWNVWLSRSEFEVLPRMASTFEREIAIRLMGDCGLRVQEVLDVQPAHISRMTDDQQFILEVTAGIDDTSSEAGKKHIWWHEMEYTDDGKIRKQIYNAADESIRLRTQPIDYSRISDVEQ